MLAAKQEAEWSLVIKPQSGWLNLRLNEVWQYRDLLLLFVRRDFVAQYKQTILGPAWFFIQPLLTTLVFTVIFGNVANISTDGMPKVLFYLSGIVLWTYFADCFTKTSNTFVTNQGIFGKVYFPRLIIPLSVVINNLFKLGIQFLMFLVFWIYFLLQPESNLQPNKYILLLPYFILVMASLGLGAGMIISSLTTKYRDLTFLVGFGVQLLMYASPVVYPVSTVPEKYKLLVMLNPATSIIEGFKKAFLGGGYFDPAWLGYSGGMGILIILMGILVFNKVEKSFIDTV